jgi:uncharacterized protein (TIGR03083 family)
MTSRAVVDLTTLGPLHHRTAMALQAEELDRTLTLLRALEADDWRRPTDCPAWDVHRMYLHVLGACEAGASMRENIRQMATALRRRRRHGGPLEAALSHVQVAGREDLTPAALVDRLAAVAPRTVRGRTRVPALARRARLKVDGPVVERWSLGYLIGTIYLRDLWMHRVDAARAIGQPLVLTADHDGVIVADVAAEWARRHGRPVALTLTGPAGGVFDTGGGAAAEEVLELDAVEFCRTLAGRAPAPGGLLQTIVPF